MTQPALKPTPFAIAREAMVVSQLYPSGIITEDVLNAYRTIPRELFVPPQRQAVCYLDDSVSFPNGRTLLEPLIHATMVDKAAIKKTDKVLDIGGVTGYSAAILAMLGKAVVAIEQDQEALDVAQHIWKDMGLLNIMAVNSAPEQGCPSYAPYDVILINGAVASVPEALQAQLATGGRLVCIETRAGSSIGQLKLYIKNGTAFSGSVIGEAAAPYVPGCEPKTTFVF